MEEGGLLRPQPSFLASQSPLPQPLCKFLCQFHKNILPLGLPLRKLHRGRRAPTVTGAIPGDTQGSGHDLLGPSLSS